jgi:hypothetical protein
MSKIRSIKNVSGLQGRTPEEPEMGETIQMLQTAKAVKMNPQDRRRKNQQLRFLPTKVSGFPFFQSSRSSFFENEIE